MNQVQNRNQKKNCRIKMTDTNIIESIENYRNHLKD